jgi:hypothetical protein
VLACLLLGAAGCGGSAPDDGSLQLLMQPDQGQADPFQDPTSMYLRIRIDDGTAPPLVDQTFTLAAGASYELDHVPTGSPRNFTVDVEDSTFTPTYEGTKNGVDLVAHQHNTVTILMRKLP